jgi:hypothetical protein
VLSGSRASIATRGLHKPTVFELTQDRTRVRNRMAVGTAERDSITARRIGNTYEFTQARSPTHVNSVTRHSLSIILSDNTYVNIPVKSRSLACCVTRDFRKPAISRNIHGVTLVRSHIRAMTAARDSPLLFISRVTFHDCISAVRHTSVTFAAGGLQAKIT